MSKENNVDNNKRGMLLLDLLRDQCTVEELAKILKPLLKGESSVAGEESSVAREESPVRKEPLSRATIAKALMDLGLPANLLGYGYISQALELCYNDPERLQHVCKGLYYDLAKANNTTASRVERAIRHAIERMCDRALPEVLEEYFGNTISMYRGKPTNTEFLAALTTYLRIKCKE